jgi:hypothetical protein
MQAIARNEIGSAGKVRGGIRFYAIALTTIPQRSKDCASVLESLPFSKR